MNVDKYIKDIYDENLSTNENYQEISKKIGISKQYFANIVYKSKDNFNKGLEGDSTGLMKYLAE